MSRPPTDIVVNRRARHLATDTDVRRAILAPARAAGDRARVHETSAIEDLEAIAKEIADRGSSAVVLAGGDGSYMAGVTALARAFGDRPLPPIALAPGGTVSTVARNWGAQGTMAHAARRVVIAALGDSLATTPRPTLRVTDTNGADHVGFIFGAGLVASFFDVYYASKRQGYAGAARIVARVFAGSFVPMRGALARRILTPVPCTLSIDGVPQRPEAWSLIAASVVRNLGLHMVLTYRAAEETGRFHAVASALGARRLGPQMPRVLAGRGLVGEGRVDDLVSKLTIDFPAEGPYVLDGDVFRARRVDVTAGPVLDVIR